MLRGGLMEFDAEFKFAKIQNPHVEGGGGSWNLMPSSNLLKSKIPMLRVGTGLQKLMLSSNLLKSKIPMLRGRLTEFDAEFTFAKNQNSYVEGGWGSLWNLMLSPNLLLKKKIFAKNFLSFRTKIGTVLFWTSSTKWFAYTKYWRTTIIQVFNMIQLKSSVPFWRSFQYLDILFWYIIKLVKVFYAICVRKNIQLFFCVTSENELAKDTISSTGKYPRLKLAMQWELKEVQCFYDVRHLK